MIVPIRKHLALLGYPVKDRVTGFTGVVASISFDLYGCVQAVVTPPAKPDGACPDARYFDTPRLIITGDRVMDPPDFDAGSVADGKKGAAEKPQWSKG